MSDGLSPNASIPREISLPAKRIIIYVSLFVFLTLFYFLSINIPLTSGPLFHTVSETISFILALTAGILSLVRYYSRKNLTFLFLGTGFLGTGIFDIYHAVVTSEPIRSIVPSGIQEIFIWSWTASRGFLAVFLFFSWLFWRKEEWFVKNHKEKRMETIIYVSAPLFMITVFLICWFFPLPSPYFKIVGIQRPGDALAGLFFLFALGGYLQKGSWRRDDVENWLIISLIFAIFTQAGMAYSLRIHDMGFILAHFFKNFSYIAILTGLLISMYHLFRETETVSFHLAEAKLSLEKYSENLESLVRSRTVDLDKKNQELEQAIQELKTTQNRLVAQEKLASLGGLTAGIAHEIKNPLNFINNFSLLAQRNALNLEKIIDKYKSVYEEKDLATTIKLLTTMKDNLSTVSEQGKRADTIIKRMLEHARSQDDAASLVDINSLIEEYVALAYHGIRAQDPTFHVKIEMRLDRSVEKLYLIASDMSRVFLNLLSNAFYALNQKGKQGKSSYEPSIVITTQVEQDNLIIRFRDNGIGIPDYLIPKVFLPFFTTRPVGQGTGLGLSISHDIIREHHGEMTLETKEGEFAEFILRLPLNKLREEPKR